MVNPALSRFNVHIHSTTASSCWWGSCRWWWWPQKWCRGTNLSCSRAATKKQKKLKRHQSEEVTHGESLELLTEMSGLPAAGAHNNKTYCSSYEDRQWWCSCFIFLCFKFRCNWQNRWAPMSNYSVIQDIYVIERISIWDPEEHL